MQRTAVRANFHLVEPQAVASSLGNFIGLVGASRIVGQASQQTDEGVDVLILPFDFTLLALTADLANSLQEKPKVEGLTEKVVNFEPQCLDGSVEFGIPGDENEVGFRQQLAQLGNGLESVHPRHTNVGYHDLVKLLPS